MAELTIDTTENPEGSLSADELDSLEVGTQLHELDDQLLAGKYRDAQELEKAYMELQGKFSSGERELPPEQEQPEAQQEQPKQEEEVRDVDGNILDTIYSQLDEGPTEEVLEQLSKMNPEDIAKMHCQYRLDQEAPQELTETNIQQLQGSVGGGENYNQMLGWAKDNLSEGEIGMYDQVMAKGDPVSCFFAVQALAGRFYNSQGFEGEMLTGKAAATKAQDVFRSQAEVVEAMKDSRYENDPAYRQDVFDKLDQSQIQY